MERSHIAYYFGNHDEMLLAAIQKVVATAQSITTERLRAAGTAEKQLQAVAEAAFDHILAYPKHAAVLCYFYHLCAHDKSYRELHTHLRQMGSDRIGAILATLPQLGVMNPEERAALAKTLQVMIFGYVLDAVTTNASYSVENAKQRTIDAICRIVGIARQ